MPQTAGRQALSNNPTNLSVPGIRYGDGVIQLPETFLSSSGFGTPWGQTVSWTNGPGYAAKTDNGAGTVVSQQPYLLPINGGNTLAVIEDGTTAELFDKVGNNYVPEFFDQNKLTDPPNAFTLTDTTGYQYVFADFSNNYPVAEQGQLLTVIDPYGNTTNLDYNTAGQLTEVVRSQTVNGTTTTHGPRA